MKYFLDTEFIEDGKTIELLSIGIRAETGDIFYAENSEADWNKAGDWVKTNVLPHMAGSSATGTWLTRAEIADALVMWVNTTNSRYKNNPIQFWGYYADYDWVVLCQLFGTMMDLPKGFPMYCMDLKQLCMMLGNPDLPPQTSGEHNALHDAVWNMDTYEHLRNLMRQDYGRLLVREMLK